MNEYLDIEGNDELWSQTDFTQGSDFALDVESFETHINGLFDTVGCDPVDIVANEPPRKSRIRNGPRLLPKIREQDRMVDSATPTRYQVSKGRRPTNTPWSRFATPSKTLQTSSFSTNDGLYSEYAQQAYTQEHIRAITPPLPALDFTSSRTPEDHDNSFASTYGSFLGLSQANGPDLSNDLPVFPLYDDYYNLSTTRKSLNTMQPGRAVFSSMYPSSRPRISQALTQEPCQSLYRPTSRDTTQSQRPETVSAKRITLLRYLSLPNPDPDLVEKKKLVKKINLPGPSRDPHFWFDVRNIRLWSTFTVEWMLDIPELKTLLHSEVLCDDLPGPGRVCLDPVSLKDVHLAHYEHYAMKLNAALKASSAQTSLQMRDNHGGNILIPDFLSSPSNDQQQTTSGNTHVVGILLCHDLWNSGMRNHNAIEQVKYLRGLARLQHALREHGTRYGFIITKIELVCVRYGGDDVVAQQCVPRYTFPHTTSSAFIPIFGFFEIET
ncbi:hypothetical protein E4T44_06785 [Aureobasidium sp. EXF-8845]|nr:hypothetical protein E4T44_06785 [Aureobasidium sp. EXF-8845]KAI4847507.1 hypothetical protein E4T45_06751 [Aureobasidium sp. EXF-8846]